MAGSSKKKNEWISENLDRINLTMVKEKKERSEMNKESMEFVVYLIHACANKWNLTPKQVYQKLSLTGCISHYLVPHYDILHTQGSSYLVDDIGQYLKARGEII